MTDAQLSQGDDGKKSPLGNDEVVQQLVLEHQALDRRLRQLSGLPFLTDQQQFEETALKKKKLAVKDRLHALAGHAPPAGSGGNGLGH